MCISSYECERTTNHFDQNILTQGKERNIWPGTAISDAPNLCTAVGGDQNKEFKAMHHFWGKRSQGNE